VAQRSPTATSARSSSTASGASGSRTSSRPASSRPSCCPSPSAPARRPPSAASTRPRAPSTPPLARSPSDALRELSGVTAELVDLAAAAAGTTVVLTDIAPAERWAHRHPVNRAALGLLLATELFHRHGWIDSAGVRQFERAGERLPLLGLGLLLADIGNVAVPADVLHRRGPPSDGDRALIRRHPEAGAALLPRSTSARVAGVVGDHHERADGTGYPRGLRAEEIHQFAAIAAVADVFAAMTAERPYRAALAPRAAFDAVVQGAGSAFHSEVVAVFRHVVAPHPPGTEVVLADGRAGVVAAVDAHRPNVPLVRFADGERRVDTRTELAA
jgi:HD-GYP domain-containing protein (c-di-GMP phosphodiesterase class II)